MARVLIVDDDEQMCRLLAKKINRMGHEAEYVMTLGQVLPAAEQVLPDVAFMDVFMPDGNGLEMLAALRNCPSEPEVIIITGMGDPDGAEKAIKSGAWDYVEKGASLEDLVLPLTRALQYRQEKLASRPLVALKREGIVGNSASMQACLDLLAQAAACDANVLISGETGTGKELFAMALHQNSARTGRKFVVVDCAALPETLVESLLFGHEKGSFTGADQTRQGLVAQAHGGTLFLDEVGELTLPLQAKLLRLLQEKEFERLGSTQTRRVDCRFIAATRRDLGDLAASGRFREDLYYRLNVFPITIPPLRQRREDIEPLALCFLDKYAGHYGRRLQMAPQAFTILKHYPWPGNVRELDNLMERLVIMVDKPVINLADLPSFLFHREKAGFPEPDLNMSRLEEMEKREVVAALERHHWVQSHAAGELGITLRQLGYRIKKFGLEKTVKERRRRTNGPLPARVR